jgi:hypothetical protein
VNLLGGHINTIKGINTLIIEENTKKTKYETLLSQDQNAARKSHDIMRANRSSEIVYFKYLGLVATD